MGESNLEFRKSQFIKKSICQTHAAGMPLALEKEHGFQAKFSGYINLGFD